MILLDIVTDVFLEQYTIIRHSLQLFWMLVLN